MKPEQRHYHGKPPAGEWPAVPAPLAELHDTAARWLLRCPAQQPGFRCVDVSDGGGQTCPIGHRMVLAASLRRRTA